MRARVHLTRFHGVFAPNSKRRAQITPVQRGKGNQAMAPDEQGATPCHVSMTWAQRLKRVFNIETSIQCGGAVKIIACIEDPGVIKMILDHLNAKTSADTSMRPESRAPPQAVLFS